MDEKPGRHALASSPFRLPKPPPVTYGCLPDSSQRDTCYNGASSSLGPGQAELHRQSPSSQVIATEATRE